MIIIIIPRIAIHNTIQQHIMVCSRCRRDNSGEGIQKNCALGDKFLQFGMVLGMGIRFSKTTAYKLG